MRTNRFVSVAVVALVLGGCSRCGKPAPKAAPTVELARVIPKDAAAVIIVPDLLKLGERIGRLEEFKAASFAAQLQGFSNARQLTNALMTQAGLDLRSKEALEKNGLAPEKGLAIAFLSDDEAITVVPLRDGEKLKTFLARFASQRLGAAVAETRDEGGAKLHVFTTAAGAPPRLAMLIKDQLAFIAADNTISALPKVANLKPEQSLKSDETFAASVGRLNQLGDFLLHVPMASPRFKSMFWGGVTVTCTLEEESLSIVADVPWRGPSSLLGLFKKEGGPELLGLLPEDAFLVGRLSGDPKLLAPFWKDLVGPHLARAFTDAGFDFEKEVLGNLKPGGSFALSLASDVKLSGGVPSLDVRRTNPFRFAHLTAVAEAVDGAKIDETLSKMPGLAPRFGARIEAVEDAGTKRFLTTYSQGEGVHFAGVGNRVVLGAPMGRLDQMLGRLATQPADLGPLSDPALRSVFDSHSVAMVIDLSRLAESIKALPSSAWGIGGFAIKATTVRWLEAVDDLREVTVVADAKDKAIQARIDLRLRPKPSKVDK